VAAQFVETKPRAKSIEFRESISVNQQLHVSGAQRSVQIIARDGNQIGVRGVA